MVLKCTPSNSKFQYFIKQIVAFRVFFVSTQNFDPVKLYNQEQEEGTGTPERDKSGQNLRQSLRT